MAGPAGFEPATFGSEGSSESFIDQTDPLEQLFEKITAYKEQFGKWLTTQELTEITKETYLSKIANIKSRTSLERAITGSKNDRLALRAFLRFLYEQRKLTLEEYERYKQIVKLKKTKTDDREYTDEDIIRILLWAKEEKARKYYLYLRLVIESGLRRKHACIAYNKLIEETYTQISDDAVRIALFEREGEKQAFYCYCSKETADMIRELGEKIHYNTLTKRLYGILFNAIRKWWTDIAMDAKMSESIIDFCQGRAPETVRAKFYIKKRKKADEQYPAVLKLIQERIYSKLENTDRGDTK